MKDKFILFTFMILAILFLFILMKRKKTKNKINRLQNIIPNLFETRPYNEYKKKNLKLIINEY